MSGYIGAQPVPQATQHREAFTATASQTSFATVGYTPQFVDVYLNGVKLAAADYTATNGSDIVLTTGAALDDILEYVAYTPFEVASQTFTGTTTVDALVATSVSAGTLVAGRATYGGTADVITITTGLSLAALTTGMEIRFRATAANTGATTINVDAIGAVTALTITDAALPADYIRTDVDTVIRYNGTNWIADRQIERGTNANGEYTRWADGTQWAYEMITIGAPSTWSGSSGGYYIIGTWTYPIAFAETPYITCSGDQQQVLASSIANIIMTVRRRTNNSSTAAQWGAHEVRVSNSANSPRLDLHATGLWY